jgi:hypothetical protein
MSVKIERSFKTSPDALRAFAWYSFMVVPFVYRAAFRRVSINLFRRHHFRKYRPSSCQTPA